MQFYAQLGWAALLCFATSPGIADETSPASAEMRILSWNISGDAFVTHPAEFRSLLVHSRANILLLDEVSPAAGRGGGNPEAGPARPRSDTG